MEACPWTRSMSQCSRFSVLTWEKKVKLRCSRELRYIDGIFLSCSVFFLEWRSLLTQIYRNFVVFFCCCMPRPWFCSSQATQTTQTRHIFNLLKLRLRVRCTNSVETILKRRGLPWKKVERRLYRSVKLCHLPLKAHSLRKTLLIFPDFSGWVSCGALSFGKGRDIDTAA